MRSTKNYHIRKRRSWEPSVGSVFVPTTLNVLSILMFLRFGFILGQSGIVGTLGMLIASYVVCLITTLSISAISSNGTVRGGGAYYLISRSLGPEFGGSIGLVFYLGCVFNTGLNAVGLVDCVLNNFGMESGTTRQLIPEDYWWKYLYATGVLVLCTIICLLGSSIFAKASNLLLIILLLATLAIPFSAVVVDPFYDSRLDISFTGLSVKTFKENLLPRFNKEAAGSQNPEGENFQDLFGILFPACSGIFAGASMSGDLRNPSKAIPRGTLQGLLLTFMTYTLVILSMGASITRDSMYKDLNIIQNTNISGKLILMGEFATSFFSALMGVIGSAKSLQALARDNVFPGLSLFGQGTKSGDEPIYAILFTYLLSQLTLLFDINQIASFITMTYLMTFFATNLACFLLKIGSAPNFRPSFKYFTWWTAASGAVLSGVIMFFVDGLYATSCVGILVTLFLIVHYTTPPKSWGDVSQSLIYHQVRKYLLRLKTEHVKFWRPQVLLFVNDPRNSWKLIQFCNAMKKGALYVLGHIIVTPDFQESFPELKRQQTAWMKYIDFSKIKGFVQIAVAPTVEWGARNIVLSAGLGGMRPNIAVLGFYNMEELRMSQPLIDVPHISVSSSKPGSKPGSKGGSIKIPLQGQLPTDNCRPEKAVGPQSYVNILEDLLLSLQINVAIAKGFSGLELPEKGVKGEKKYIDLWPIQMSVEIGDSGAKGNILTTNFDTYTLILQLGCILHTVPAWKQAYKVRVLVFVEYKDDVREERERVKKLLENLRIQAEVVVTYLSNGELKNYETIVNGSSEENPEADAVLGKEEWWKELQQRRKKSTAPKNVTDLSTLFSGMELGTSFQQGFRKEIESRFKSLNKFMKTKKRHTISGLNRLGMPLSMTMRTHKLRSEVFGSDSEFSETEAESSDDESSSDGALSENDIEDYQEPEEQTLVKKIRRASTGNALTDALRHNPYRHTPVGYLVHDNIPRRISGAQSRSEQSSAGASAAASTVQPPTQPPANPSIKRVRPELIHRVSSPTFSSRAIPDTEISTDDGGPSIGFSSEAPRSTPSRITTTITSGGIGPSRARASASINNEQGSSAQREYSQPANIPAAISFNDLPGKAQHLILNELIKQYSDDTAVVFTTLPSPAEGTHKSEEESLEYLGALEILTDGLPPTLLVHSNSLTVTTAL
ncbi:amino acid permease-domain-containing protein [Kalaharituber pfeilii]|nr:amino acid permease-domain-containing protein [Kalaharituber pfeilii]